MNPYEVLELTPDASADDIKAAYHRLAKRWHPDRYSGAEKVTAEERFRLISEAFSTLKDAGRRSEMDGRSPAPPAPPTTIQLQDPTISKVAPQERTVEDWYSEAKTAFENRDPNKAAALIQYVLRLDSSKPEYHVLHAKILDATNGDRKVLVKALETAIRMNPKDIDSIIRLAEFFQGVGMHARASSLWTRAHDINPNHPMFQQPAKGPDGLRSKLEGLQGLGDQFKLLVEQAKALFHRMSKRG